MHECPEFFADFCLRLSLFFVPSETTRENKDETQAQTSWSTGPFRLHDSFHGSRESSQYPPDSLLTLCAIENCAVNAGRGSIPTVSYVQTFSYRVPIILRTLFTLLDTSTLRIYLPLFATCVRGVVVAGDACRAIDSKSSDTALHPCIDRQSGVGVGSPVLFTSPEVDAQALRTRTTQYTA